MKILLILFLSLFLIGCGNDPNKILLEKNKTTILDVNEILEDDAKGKILLDNHTIDRLNKIKDRYKNASN